MERRARSMMIEFKLLIVKTIERHNKPKTEYRNKQETNKYGAPQENEESKQ